MAEPYSISVADLAARGPKDVPDAFLQGKNLLFSSPATLAFNSPGAQGFGVKRAGLSIPGSVMLLVSPGCCGRNTTALGSGEGSCQDRIYYYLLDSTDIVTGRYVLKIPEAVEELCNFLPEKPSAVMLCSTCVDALLGTDEEGICRRASARCGVPVISCTMYALSREGRVPPMAAVRRSVYSLLRPQKRRADRVNLLGHFLPLLDNCEIYPLLASVGISSVRELARCKDMDAYADLSSANFNILLNSESRLAAEWMQTELSVPFVEMARVYQPSKVHGQYSMLGELLGSKIDDQPFFEASQKAQETFLSRHGKLRFAVGECADADPFELSLSLVRAGFEVPEIFAGVGLGHRASILALAKISPDTRVYSNISPSMLGYRPNRGEIDVAIGRDACWYHPECAGVEWCGKAVPFGHAGICALYAALERAVTKGCPQSKPV